MIWQRTGCTMRLLTGSTFTIQEGDMGTYVDLGEAWRERASDEHFDVISLLKVLRERLGDEDFGKACRLLSVTPDQAVAAMALLQTGGVTKARWSYAPDLAAGEDWQGLPHLIRAFIWVYRSSGSTWLLVAGILDLARLLSATAQDLWEAGRHGALFSLMAESDWQALLESGATTSGRFGRSYWDPEVLERHVKGSG